MFKWLPKGMSVDKQVFKQLASYDVDVNALPETKCVCEKCVPSINTRK